MMDTWSLIDCAMSVQGGVKCPIKHYFISIEKQIFIFECLRQKIILVPFFEYKVLLK